MKITKLYLIIVSLVALLASNAIAAAWTGSMSEPENMKKIDGKSFYVITTADELAWFADQVNNGKSTINAVLANNIVFGKDNSTRSTVKWTPIGKDLLHQFAGILDGAGYTIYGIYVDSIPIAGIVGFLKEDGIVKNLRTNTGYIGGTFRVGGIVGCNNGTIQSVENNNRVEAFYRWNGSNTSYVSNGGDSTSIYAGGIAGRSNGSIIASSNKMPINNKAAQEGCSGGIAGYNTGEIYNSGNSGTVKVNLAILRDLHKAYSGGIAGYNTGLINKIRNIGAVTASEDYSSPSGRIYSGGIAGLSTTTIKNGINNGQITTVSPCPQNNKCYKDQIWYYDAYDDGIVASGKAKNSVDYESLKYWLNEEQVQGETENMQKDQFAWILNTTNGTESNSGVWTRTTGYPDFAKDLNLPIYKVVFNDDGTTTNRYTNYNGLVVFPEIPSAYDENFKGWYDSEGNKVESSTIFISDQVVRTVYNFYTITFNNFDGTLIESGSFDYGVMPSCSKIPTRSATKMWEYTHKGWTPALDYVTEAIAYTATYDSTKVEYKVTFMNGIDIIDEQMVPYGDAAVAPTVVPNTGYKFVGWNTSFSMVTDNLVVIAQIEQLDTFIVKVQFGSNVIIDSAYIVEGESYTLPVAPKRDGYTFDAYYDENAKKLGFAGDEITVTANLTIKAFYIKKSVSSSNSAKSSSSSQTKSSSSQTHSSSSSAPKESVISGKLEQTLGVYDWMDFIIFSGVQNYSRESFNIPFLEITESGTNLTIFGTVPGTYRDLVCNGDKKTDSLKVNGRIYKIELTIKNPNKPCNSALVLASTKTQLSVKSYNRNLQISGANIGEPYAIFDLQGRVFKKGRIESLNLNIPIAEAGNYVVKIGYRTQRVQIR